jgi:hypothetical protein
MMLLSIIFLALAAALAKLVLVHLQQRLDCMFKLFDYGGVCMVEGHEGLI